MDVVIPAYAFSRKTVQAALLNKISAKIKPEPRVEPEAPAAPEQPQGRSVDELKKRLETIKTLSNGGNEHDYHRNA